MTRFKLLSPPHEMVVEVDGTGLEQTVSVEGTRHRVAITRFEGNRMTFQVDGNPIEVELLDEGASTLRLRVAGEEFAFTRVSPDRPQARVRPRPATVEIESLLPGKVVSVRVKEGDGVNAGDPVVLIDSMKMETAVRAEVSGRVLAVLVKKGDAVRKRQPLVLVTTTGETEGDA